MASTNGNGDLASELNKLIKAARKTMRKDKGLNGDADRLPILTWLMFLKLLDDRERVREEEAALGGTSYAPICEPPYRWRDWAAGPLSFTGDQLLAFINQDEAVLPVPSKNGAEQRGPGLFHYLRTLAGTAPDDPRDVLATVFKGVQNRMTSGYLLKDVIALVDRIHFESKAEIDTLGRLYESLLREMRDAAGDSGEFYTPRPLVRFIVRMLDPQVGETVLDPASGTAGFLVEAFLHLHDQAKTVEDYATVQKSILGGEPKPLPFLLAQMNLLLHGVDAPEIDHENSLRFRLTEIGDRERVDVIATNPPFGGEEEAAILRNFPSDRQTSETALLFLQLIMRKLRKKVRSGFPPGRAGVVVPDGLLAGDGVAARVKQDLVENYNLHTVVRLPAGVFAPYTDIPTNVLFFDTSGPTSSTWYCELPLPEEYKKYSKTKPLRDEEFGPVEAWWTSRTVSENAWQVDVAEIAEAGYNLDLRNPLRMPEDLSITVAERVSGLSATLDQGLSAVRELLDRDEWRLLTEGEAQDRTEIRLGDHVTPHYDVVTILPDELYRVLGVSLHGAGPFVRGNLMGMEIKAEKLRRIYGRDFIYNRLFAAQGTFGVIPEELDGSFVSNEFPTYAVDDSVVLAEYLRLYFMRPTVLYEVEKKCRGTTKGSRNRFKEEFFEAMRITVPELDVQERIVSLAADVHQRATDLAEELRAFTGMRRHLLAGVYGGEL